MSQQLKYLCWAVIITMMACKKDPINNSKPIISITSPNSSQYYTALDTILISGQVSDDELISSITISLKDVNNVSVVQSISIFPQSKEHTIHEKMYLNNIHLNNGQYTMNVAANDGENVAQKFINVNINAFPKTRKGVFLFSNNGTTTNITKLDNAFNASIFQTSSGDFLKGVVNSYDQEIINCGSATGDLTGYAISTGQLLWSVNNNATGFAFFTGVSATKNEVFVSYYNRTIQSYLSGGIPKFSAQAFTSSYSDQTVVHNDELFISEQPEVSGTDIRLVAYYMSSGIEKQQMLLNEDVQSMFSFSENELVLFNNVGGTGVIKVYDISQNSVWQPFTLYSGAIDDVTEISNGVYVVVQNGNLSVVDRNNFSKLPYLSGIGANKVKYDSITNQLFVVRGSVLEVYDYSSKTIITTYAHTDTIKEVAFWYNR